MKNVKLAIGFATGRSNVCDIINTYYLDMLEQVSRFNKKVEITIYILMDLNYMLTPREKFYNINENVYNSGINIKYITPESIDREKDYLINREKLTEREAEMFIGYGHAKCRNTLLYYTLMDNMDYLLFWDDDEYPYACLKENNKISFIKQDNILIHLQNIENADVTIGYHCGYVSPIPYVDYHNEISEESFKKYIEAVSNDIISWDIVKERFEKDNGVTFADKNIIDNNIVKEIKEEHGGKWVAGSTLCVNLNHIDKIPSFFNPLEARGEDTFFSTRLKNAKVLRVPVYHFHDGFLKFTKIMKNKFPKKLPKITSLDEKTDVRFFKASLGWMKYKPLYIYITKHNKYKKCLAKVMIDLEESVNDMSKAFDNIDFREVLETYKMYAKYVKCDYDNYLETNRIWDKIKNSIGD